MILDPVLVASVFVFYPSKLLLYSYIISRVVVHILMCNVRSQAKQGQDTTNSNPTHVFQALQYLKKVCNHPRLVLTKVKLSELVISRSLKSHKL